MQFFCIPAFFLLLQTSIPAAQIHAIVEGVSAEQTAIAYEGALLSTPASVLPRNAQGLPVFDFMLLGEDTRVFVFYIFSLSPDQFIFEFW